MFAVDCTLLPENPGFHLLEWSGPLHLITGQIEQDERFAPELRVELGEGPLELELDYCGDFHLDGDFSQLPIYEFGGIGWAMIKNPDDEDSLLGNFFGPPSDYEILLDPVRSTTVELGDNAFRTTGVFDTRDLEAGQYVIGLTGTYIFAEPSSEDPTLRVRQDLDFEYGFPLTIVPEPTATMLMVCGLFGVFAVRGTQCSDARRC